MKLLLATANPAKIKNYRDILEEKGVEVETLSNLEIKEKFEEGFDNYEDNARAKAVFYHVLTGLPTLADDSGFELDYLNGEPGVHSRRWLGYEATDEQLIAHLQTIINSIPQEKRSARFVAATCLCLSPNKMLTVKNHIEGILTDEFNDNYPEGYPYRAFFIENTYNKYMMDLTEDEYKNINHRKKNVEELMKYLI